MALTGQQEEAAALTASDHLTDEDIAVTVGVSRKTLWVWRSKPEFAARVEALKVDMAAAVRRRGIALVEKRVTRLNDTWERMQTVIRERAADPRFEGIAGGKTGLLVRTVKGVGRGEDFQLVDIYEFDAALVRELREHEKQAAIELGQWQEKQTTTHVGAVTIRTITAVQPALPAGGGAE